MSVAWYRRSNENRFNLIFNDKSSEIDHAPTVIDTLTRSPANPSVVCTVCECSASLSIRLSICLSVHLSVKRFFITGHVAVSRLQLHLYIS